MDAYRPLLLRLNRYGGVPSIRWLEYEYGLEWSDAEFDMDGRLVAVGRVQSRPYVRRFLADGTPDQEFGLSGNAVVDLLGNSEVWDLQLDQDGRRFVIVGYGSASGNYTGGAFVARIMQ